MAIAERAFLLGGGVAVVVVVGSDTRGRRWVVIAPGYRTSFGNRDLAGAQSTNQR
jgi:hypothetical protein